jgi:hypothetical protein
MKRTFSPQERDAFAKAVSAVEGVARSAEQSKLFVNFDRQNTSLEDQLIKLNALYARSK